MLNTQNGSSLIESMITLFIISIGLLGIASLQVNTLKYNSSAQWHELAVRLNAEIATRITLQNENFNLYSTIDTSNSYSKDCIANACTDAEMVTADADDWKKEIEDNLPSGRGIISVIDASTLSLVIMWDNDNTGALGTNCSGNEAIDLTCFTTQIVQREN